MKERRFGYTLGHDTAFTANTNPLFTEKFICMCVCEIGVFLTVRKVKLGLTAR